MQPDSIVYLNKADESGRAYQVHYNAQDEFEMVNKYFLDILFGAKLKDIRFLPQINKSEAGLRERYFGDIPSKSKCPDVSASGKMVELKEVLAGKKMRRNIVNAIGDAAKKAQVVIVKLGNSLNKYDLQQIAGSQFEKYEYLEKIIFSYNETIFTFER
jgi:hypothetical protein